MSSGNNGTLKVHEKGTSSGTESNDPKVCDFNFEGFSFDNNQSGKIYIEPQGGDSNTTDKLWIDFGPTNTSGYTQTAYINDGGTLSLANGHYKSTLYGKDSQNNYSIDLRAKSKVFKVNCDINAAAPTQYNPCGTANDTYTIPTTSGVQYQVKIGSGDWNNKSAGTYNYDGASMITVRATSTDADTNVAQPNQWIFTYTDVTCTTTVVTQAALANDQTCGNGSDTYTIPDVTGVQYYVNDSAINAGTYSTNGALSITVTAAAKSGYVLSGATTWTLTFTNKTCVTATAPSTTDMCGTTGDKYTIPTTPGVIYKVNGSV